MAAMRRLVSLIIVIAFLAVSCGGNGGSAYSPTVPLQTDPYIARINPTAATAGDVVSIIGFGFSAEPTFNVVVINNVEIFADSYALMTPPSGDEIEQLTFTVPAGLTGGAQMIYVIVVDVPSNTDQTITIN